MQPDAPGAHARPRLLEVHLLKWTLQHTRFGSSPSWHSAHLAKKQGVFAGQLQNSCSLSGRLSPFISSQNTNCTCSQGSPQGLLACLSPHAASQAQFFCTCNILRIIQRHRAHPSRLKCAAREGGPNLCPRSGAYHFKYFCTPGKSNFPLQRMLLMLEQALVQ